MRKRIVVFASGSGTNFEEIARKSKENYIDGEVSLLISDRADAPVIKRAEKFGIPSIVISWQDKRTAEEKADTILKKINPDVIALAGFMRILSPEFVSKWKFKILNIHPSILPAFQGTTKAIERAKKYGVRVTGCTVHFVDESVDGGPIIAQGIVLVSPNDSEEKIRQKIQKLEHVMYPWVIKKFLEGKIKISEDRRNVVVLDADYNEEEKIFITNPKIE
ncbi:Phosphoribosylglycinamide formyltransferase [bacterium HR19]|nr:Phosphoribosylglycinamide formyltransferase [bacterium HR19]